MDKEWLEKQHSLGLSQRKIAELAGVSTPTIRAWFKKHNITTRSISESLKLNPSRSSWNEERRAKFSEKMKDVQRNRKSELSESARHNWNKNRNTILDGIIKSANARRVNIESHDLLSLVKSNTLKKISKLIGCSSGTVRRLIRERFGICNLQQYKKFKIDLENLINLYEINTQAECGKILGVSGTTIGRILQYHNIDTTIHFGPQFANTISKIVKTRWFNEDYRNKMAIVRSSTNKVSSIQKTLYSILDRMQISYEIEYVIGPYTFDCKIGNLLIECNGDYWHSIDSVLVNDENKNLYIINYHPDYKIKVIWEHEFNNETRIQNLINYWLGNIGSIIKYDFKDIKTMTVESSSLRQFFGTYHYLSHCPRGGLAIQGEIDGEVIVAALFSPLARQNLPYDNATTLELSRFCIHPNYQKHNLGSWFMSKAIKMLPTHIKTIISYSDLTHNHNGGLYKASNFKIDHIVKPDYWYARENGWILHKKTVYNKAKSAGLRESEYAKQENLKKVKGKEKICFRYDI